MSNWKYFVKRAQVWGSYAPAHDATLDNSHGVGDMINGISRGAWGGIGAGAGLFKGIWDKTLGGVPDGSLWDYVRTGWNVGKDNADLMATSMISGAADAIPFVNMETPKAVADQAQRDAMYRGLDQDAAIEMRARASTAGNLAANAAMMKAMSGTSSKVLPKIGIKGKAATIVGDAIVAAPAAPSVVSGFKDSSRMASNQAVAEYNAFADTMANLDPASEEYKVLYDMMSSQRHLNPSAFSKLRKPEYVVANQSEADSGSRAESKGTAGSRKMDGGWSMSPEVQNMIGYGLGGSVLGAMLGGKGGWWKWGLLSLLLGALHQGYGLDNAWKSISNSWKNYTR